jgi:hypothetical protein
MHNISVEDWRHAHRSSYGVAAHACRSGDLNGTGKPSTNKSTMRWAGMKNGRAEWQTDTSPNSSGIVAPNRRAPAVCCQRAQRMCRGFDHCFQRNSAPSPCMDRTNQTASVAPGASWVDFDAVPSSSGRRSARGTGDEDGELCREELETASRAGSCHVTLPRDSHWNRTRR